MIISTSLSQVVNNLEQAVRTQLVEALFADVLQVVIFLRVYLADLIASNRPGTSY